MQTFAEYMERVLYGPAGYYSSGTARSGKAGDYFTAPDVGPVFGELLTAIFQQWETRLAAPVFSVIEAGPGEGRLAQDILRNHPFRYTAVERSPSRVQKLESLKSEFSTLSVASDLNALQSHPVQGVLFGNELIDAFPVHRVRMKAGKLEELFVSEKARASGGLRFQWGAPSTPALAAYLSRLNLSLSDGYETEVNLAMQPWLLQAAAVLEKGLLLLIDYGRPAHDYYAPERTRGTLRAFSKHSVSADFLQPSSLVDLTADVDFTSLALDAREAGFSALAFMEMGTFLMQGVQALLASGGQPTVSPGLKYLLHPEGLGAAFHVLVLGKNLDLAAWAFDHNRLARLGLPA